MATRKADVPAGVVLSRRQAPEGPLCARSSAPLTEMNVPPPTTAIEFRACASRTPGPKRKHFCTHVPPFLRDSLNAEPRQPHREPLPLSSHSELAACSKLLEPRGKPIHHWGDVSTAGQLHEGLSWQPASRHHSAPCPPWCASDRG